MELLYICIYIYINTYVYVSNYIEVNTYTYMKFTGQLEACMKALAAVRNKLNGFIYIDVYLYMLIHMYMYVC
jgi:hypothetical protein